MRAGLVTHTLRHPNVASYSCGYTPLYLRQTANDITGEHTSVMLRPLNCEGMEEAPARGWLNGFTTDFARRLAALLSFRFRHFDPLMAYQLLTASVSTGPCELAAWDGRFGVLPSEC